VQAEKVVSVPVGVLIIHYFLIAFNILVAAIAAVKVMVTE
jgi:hypothetical protein